MFVDPSFFEAIQRLNMVLQSVNRFVEMNMIAMKFAAKEKGCFPAAGRSAVYHASSLMYDRRKEPLLFFRRARPPPKTIQLNICFSGRRLIKTAAFLISR